MKKFTPYVVVFALLITGVVYFIYQYSPSTLEKKESDFAVKNIEAVTKVRLTDVKGNTVTLTKKGNKWLVNDKYDVNDGALGLLFNAIQKIETNYRTQQNGEKNVLNDMARLRNKCEIYINNNDKPFKVYYVGGSTADGEGTYMIMEREGQMAAHSYVTHVPGTKAFLTTRYYPDLENWRSIWVLRDNDQSIQSLKVTYNREVQKSFEVKKIAKDSFIVANSEGKVQEQPKQKFIHQYLNFYSELPLEVYENKNKAARDTVTNVEPFCTISVKRNDGSASTVTLFYIPVNDQTRVQYDDEGRKLVYDIEHYYITFNNKEDFAMVQFYTWGKVLHTYQDFFVKPAPPKNP